jgi:hypothetical protein
MPYKFLDITATPSVRAAQAANGSREMWEHFKGHYVQHRGGPPGFLKVLDAASHSPKPWPCRSCRARR